MHCGVIRSCVLASIIEGYLGHKSRFLCGWPSLFFGVVGTKVDKPLKILIKTSNATEYIESYIQNIEASRVDDPIM